mmetsp:Transcript_49114/g.106972  ORF Transcript_49114/g.106972 Transcript_49114/m.106972 type:complete len:201 (+) Transcript_49114:1736-2338(+)
MTYADCSCNRAISSITSDLKRINRKIYSSKNLLILVNSSGDSSLVFSAKFPSSSNNSFAIKSSPPIQSQASTSVRLWRVGTALSCTSQPSPRCARITSMNTFTFRYARSSPPLCGCRRRHSLRNAKEMSSLDTNNSSESNPIALYALAKVSSGPAANTFVRNQLLSTQPPTTAPKAPPSNACDGFPFRFEKAVTARSAAS